MEQQTAIDRLRIFAAWAKSHGYVRSEREFEAVCGLSNGYMNNLQSRGKGCIGSDKITLVARKFPMLDVKWLCSGDGCMVAEEKSRSESVEEALELVRKLEESIRLIE